MSRRIRGAMLAALAVAVPLVVPSLAPVGASAADSGCAEKYGVTSTSNDSWSATEPISRTFGDGTPATTNCIHLQVNKHTNLQDHERIKVTWSGAHPTAGRALNPFGETGLEQEYPVMLMQCRGTDTKDNPKVAASQAVTPDTCWTNTYFERTSSADPGQGIWQQDADATAADIAHISGIDPSKIPDECNVSSTFDYHITPFLASDGTLYPGCSSQSMPPEATVNSVSIPQEAMAFTNLQGDGSFDFDPRTNLDNASLGCSSTQPCTL